MRCKLTLLFFVFIIPYFFASAQNNTAQFFKRCSVKTLNYEQGLLNNGTTNIITDALGFTWVSAKTGMQRYNGYILETINPVIDKEVISINSPIYFFGLQNGLIWISYKQGVLEYNPYTSLFKKIISISNSANLNFSLIPLKETNEGILCMQHAKGLIIYSRQGVITKTIYAENSFVEHVFSEQEIFESTNFAVTEHSIFIYNGKDQIQQINLQTNQINYIPAINLFSFTCNNNNLYIISNKGLTCTDIQNKKQSKNVSFRDILKENLNSALVVLDGNNQLRVALNNHLFEFDTACNYLKEFTDLNRNPIVSQGFIQFIYADRFRRIWLLTNDDIKRIQNVDIPFQHFIYANAKNNFVRSLYYDKEKHVLLAGCLNGGIQLYDTLGNALWQKPVITENVKDIIGIEKLADNKFLIITFGKGWYILNLQSKKVDLLKIPGTLDAILKSNFINYLNNIIRVNDSTVFIATIFNVFRCIFKNDHLRSAEPLLPLENNFIYSITCFIYPANKTLWVGTVSGVIYRIDQNKSVKTMSIPDNYLVRSLAEDVQHNIWAGTDKGLYIYNNSGELIKKITVQSGLLNDCVYALLPVKNKAAVFASSNMGLSYISLSGDIINYTKESGLQENEFNTGSALNTPDGKFYFGGINGITAFYPAALSEVKDSPVLNITRLIVNDSLYDFSPNIWRNDSIILNYNQNHLQFDVASLGLLTTNEYEYKYRLKGFEKAWQTTHQPTGIKYILPSGNYLLEINCAPIFSSGNIFKKTITIIISPPWWQTWWFKILMALLFVAVIAFIVQQYLHRQFKKRIRVLQVQHEIQQERERISRDLHDNLGAYAAAIASNVATIKTLGNEKDENVLHQLKNNSQSIITQLNDTIWALNKEAISLTAVSDRFKVFLQKIQPNYPFINISIEENILDDKKLSPAHALHLFRIMQEAVNNALRHSNCSNIVIQINSADNWNVIIKDNGKGFLNYSEKLMRGNGLKNMQLRSKDAGWDISWKDATPTGTELMISSVKT